MYNMHPWLSKQFYGKKSAYYIRSFTVGFFSFMLIATGPPVGPIIAVNGLNDAFWWHSHSLYGLVKKN